MYGKQQADITTNISYINWKLAKTKKICPWYTLDPYMHNNINNLNNVS